MGRMVRRKREEVEGVVVTTHFSLYVVYEREGGI